MEKHVLWYTMSMLDERRGFESEPNASPEEQEFSEESTPSHEEGGDVVETKETVKHAETPQPVAQEVPHPKEVAAMEAGASMREEIQQVVRHKLGSEFQKAPAEAKAGLQQASDRLLNDVEPMLTGMDETNRHRESDRLYEHVHTFVKELQGREPFTSTAARNITEQLLDLRDSNSVS